MNQIKILMMMKIFNKIIKISNKMVLELYKIINLMMMTMKKMKMIKN